MINTTIIAIDESIAAIKLNEQWHFHYDIDYMFILDIMKYDYLDGEVPQLGDLRYTTL